jgi:glycyl-tRNA synthetase beta subunit
MKSINQLLENDKELLSNNKVKNLIDYCLELEDKVIEHKMDTSNEIVLLELVRDIHYSVSQYIKDDKKMDCEKGLQNLKKYIEDYSDDNNIIL